MKRKLFGDLVKSIREAGAIRRGELRPARKTTRTLHSEAVAVDSMPTAKRHKAKRRK